MDAVFFTDSGSVSVEVAIKLAFQYWISKDMGEKSKLITIRRGYHGDTFGAMSVCDPVTGMHEIFKNILPKHYFAREPKIPYGSKWDDEDILDIKKFN